MIHPEIITYKNSILTLYPERGGIVTSIKFKDIELLYQGMLDGTLYDRSKSVRGGIPILFPNAGFLTAEEQEDSGYSLPQHGFARTNEWEITEGIVLYPILGGQSTRLSQSLSSENILEKHGYMWNGRIENTILFGEDTIELRYTIANNSKSSLPISFGLHPYFSVPLGSKADIIWDFVGGETITGDIENWANGGTTRIDVPKDGVIRVSIPGIGKLEMSVSPDFRRLWIWSLPDCDFVCIEPTMGDDGNILNHPTVISAGAIYECCVSLNLQN